MKKENLLLLHPLSKRDKLETDRLSPEQLLKQKSFKKVRKKFGVLK